MEEVVRTRLKLIFQNLTALIGKNQKELEVFQRNETADISKAEILSSKLKAALERFASETYNYFKVVNEPCADEMSRFTQVQLRGEELATELDYHIRKSTAQAKLVPDIREKVAHVASKLPKMELAKFDGDVLKWHQFWDQFASNVDSRNINDVDKLLYLQSVLEGEAKRAIDGLDTTNKNYQIAVSTLRDRYGKPSTIIDAHYAALYRIKTADKSISEGRRALNEIERHLRVLESLGEDVNHNHLRVMIMQKFSEEVVYELRVKLGTDTDTIADIRMHLEHIISAREDSNRIMLVTPPSEQPSTSKSENEKFSLETLYTAAQVQQTPRTSLNRPFQHQNHHRGRFKRTRGIDRRVNYRTPSQTNNKYHDTRKRQHNTQDQERKEPETKRKKPTCIFCGNGHFNDECRVVRTVQERKNKLGGRCYNCLAKGHQTKDCKSNKNCRHCGKYGSHNRALCPTRDSIKTDALHVSNPIHEKGLTILQTAIIRIGKINQAQQTPCRILLDCGSQRTYITKDLAEKLKLPELEKNHLSVFTFGTDHPNEIESPLVNFEMTTKINKRMIIHANVVPHITKDVPTLPHDITQQVRDSDHRLKSIVIADDTSLGNRVDILLGNDYYFSLINGEKIQISDNLYLVNSIFGWMWSGRRPNTNVNDRDQLSVVTYFQSSIECSSFCEPDLPLKSDNIKRLWDLESIGITDSPKAERDDEAVKQFNETIKFFDNRYHVKWPWIEYPPLLPSNFGLSLGRLKTLLRRLDDDTVLSYDNIIREQLNKNIIEEVPNPNSFETHPVHYLPHHCIAQGGKLRLVYDASAKTKDNKSLNECLYRGPLLLEDLTGLLLRFRENRIGVVADVEKAFLQIGLQTVDRDVTRFLWPKNVKEELIEENLMHLRFQRVPFGIISSPFLLNATIRFHLNKSNDRVHARIAQDIYVDNLVTGAESTDEAMNLYQISKRAFDELSMNLREWNSNSDEFLDSVPPIFRSKEMQHMKVLGLNWNRVKDSLNLRFNLADKDLDKINTKREVLRLVASIFDPCGFSVPLVLPAKLFLQDLWHQKVEWDTKLDEAAQVELQIVIESLSHINNIEIPRLFNERLLKHTRGNTVHHELHAFTDSSMQAYAAAVYLRSISDKDIQLSFVIGKSRLVERAKQTDLQIPKLELLGVLIGKRLLKITVKSLRLPVTKLYLWTDNQIVISWCNSEKLLPPFVAKRVEEIKQDNVCLRYVPTQMNPADVATRTKGYQDDVSHWLGGPDFLYHEQSRWPSNMSAPKNLRNERIHNLLVGQGPTEVHQQGQDITSHRPNQLPTESDSNMEVDSETNCFQSSLRRVQNECFPEELEGKETNLTRSLGIYKDNEGILRCGGRLKNTDWSACQKNPILLPRNHDFTSKLIEDTHKANYHVGVSHTLALVRQKYWIPKGRSQVQKILRQCQSCRKYAGGPFKMPPMAQLPSERVTYSKAFTHSGVDYFGPLLVNVNGTSVKRWVSLYTCLAVRAIHMEVVADLTAEECLLALRRFVASRGVPETISSDNALQFKLTADVLTSQYCVTNNIKWKFIPELAPWFGGYYERLIGIVKNCLKKTLDKHLLNDPQLHTVIKEIEAVVNSRPLTVVGNEIEHILTPADFLRIDGPSMPAISDHEFLEPATVTKSNLIDSWKRGQRILQEYIQMFSHQYLNSLRDRRITHRQARVVVDAIPKVGDVVQIKGDSNRALWKVGKISAVISGKDGKVRVARVTTSPKETLTRSIAHLYPLEIQESAESPRAPNRTIPQTTNETISHDSDLPRDSPGNAQATKNRTQNTQIDASGDDAQATLTGPDQVPASAHVDSNQQRPKRLSAQKAREKMKEWTAQLISVLRSDFRTVDLVDLS